MTSPQTHPFTLDLTVEELLAGSPDAFFALDREWHFLHVNPAAERLLERSADELVGREVWEEFPAARESTFFREYNRALSEQVIVQFTAFYAPLNRWFAVQAVPQRSGLSVFFHDVTAIKEAEKRAAAMAELHLALRTVATAVAAGASTSVLFELVCRQSVRLADATAGWLVRFSEYGCRVAEGYASDGSAPHVGDVLPVVDGGILAAARAGRSTVVTRGAPGLLAQLGMEAAAIVPVTLGGEAWGGLVVAWRDARPQAGESEPWLREFSELVAMGIDNAQTHDELARQARTDALTGLANLRSLHPAIEERIEQAQTRGIDLSLLLLDVDHFKTVNDGRGHEIGDAVLRAMADVLRDVCRRVDLAARVGGDEFALVLMGCDGAEALKIGDRIRRRIPAACAGDLPDVTVSIGVAEWEPGLDRKALHRRADDALYWAKLHGRDATWAYQPELMESTEAEQRAAKLRRAGAAVDPAELERGLRSARAFWQSALDALTKHIAVVDRTGRIIATNAAWRAFGTENGASPASTGIGANYLDVCDAAQDPIATRVGTGIREILAGQCESFEVDYPCHGPAAEQWYTVRASVFGSAGSRRVIVQHENVTARRRAEAESAFRARLLDFVTTPLCVMDADGRLTYCNSAFEKLLGWRLDEVQGRSVSELPTLLEASIDRAAAERALTDRGRWEGEVVVIGAGGTLIPAVLNVAQVRDEGGSLAGRVATVFDLRERTAYERSLQTTRDHMRTITESVADGLLVVASDGLISYANPAARRLLGHESLDGMPARVALYDGQPTAATADLLDRPGHRTSAEDTFWRAGGRPLPVEWSAASLSTAADVGTGVPVSAAGSRVIVFRDASERRATEEQLRRTAEQLRWAKLIADALAQGRFELHAQPIVSADTEEVVDHELLLRLRQADGTLIAPGAFLPAAEEHGLMRDIDLWVVAQAVGHAAEGMPVHFNLSAQSVGEPAILEALRAGLSDTGAQATLLTIEITETALIADRERAAAFACAVRQLGCHVALDDFGAGYNSFARAKGVPADVIKIDRQFIVDVASDSASQSVVKGIVAFAQNLGLRTIAEGVEDAATHHRLCELGVHYAQGWHFGFPQPIRRAGT